MNIMVPIKVLLDMDVRCKSTYRAALEGIDLGMVELLKNAGYVPHVDDAISLYRLPTDIRLTEAQKRLDAFDKNKEVGLCDFVKYAHQIFYDFLQVVKLGHLHDMEMSGDGLFNVAISCMLHESGLESTPSTKAKFREQLDYLTSLGLVYSKQKGLSSYHFINNDNNCGIIKRLLSERGAKGIEFKTHNNMIDRVSFKLEPISLRCFVESKIDYSLPVTDELNDDEMTRLKKLVREIPSTLSFIKQSPDMLQTCACLAESYCSEIEEIVGYDGEVLRQVKSRHEKERTANIGIRDIEYTIGSNFPAEIAREIMEKLRVTMSYFCIENLQAMCMNFTMDRFGSIRMDVKFKPNTDDLRYIYYFDEDKYNEPSIPDATTVKSVFDVRTGRNGGMYFVDTEKNKELIARFLRIVCGFEIESFVVKKTLCRRLINGVDASESDCEELFIIEQATATVDHIEGILKQFENSNVNKQR